MRTFDIFHGHAGHSISSVSFQKLLDQYSTMKASTEVIGHSAPVIIDD